MPHCLNCIDYAAKPMHDTGFTKFIQPKVVTRSIVYTTYHANRKKKEEREKSQNEKTAYITRHELPPPEPAMSSIDAESPVDYNNQTFVVSKQKNEEEKHNKTKVFIPQDPVQHQESFSYQNYKTHHQTEKPDQNESFSYKNYQNHHPQQNKQPIEKPKRTYTSLERELISKEALITQQNHEIDRLLKEANKLKSNQTASNTKDSSKPVPSYQNQVKSTNPAPVGQPKNQAAASSSNTGGQSQSNMNTKSQNQTNQTMKK